MTITENIQHSSGLPIKSEPIFCCLLFESSKVMPTRHCHINSVIFAAGQADLGSHLNKSKSTNCGHLPDGLRCTLKIFPTIQLGKVVAILPPTAANCNYLSQLNLQLWRKKKSMWKSALRRTRAGRPMGNKLTDEEGKLRQKGTCLFDVRLG